MRELVLQYQLSAHDEPAAFIVPDITFQPADEGTLVLMLAANGFHVLNVVERQLYDGQSEWRPGRPNAGSSLAAAAAATAPPPPAAAAAAAGRPLVADALAAAAAAEATSTLATAGTAEQPRLEGQVWAGSSDFCLMLLASAPGAFATPLAVGEMKRPGVLRYDGTASLVELYSSMPRVTNALSQVFGYMVDSRVGLGVLSTLKHTWLLCRLPEEPGCLQVDAPCLKAIC